MRENAIAHQSAVDEEKLIAAAAESDSARHVAGCARRVVCLFDLRQIFIRFAAEDLHDAVANRGGGRQIENQASVVDQAK